MRRRRPKPGPPPVLDATLRLQLASAAGAAEFRWCAFQERRLTGECGLDGASSLRRDVAHRFFTLRSRQRWQQRRRNFRWRLARDAGRSRSGRATPSGQFGDGIPPSKQAMAASATPTASHAETDQISNPLRPTDWPCSLLRAHVRRCAQDHSRPRCGSQCW